MKKSTLLIALFIIFLVAPNAQASFFPTDAVSKMWDFNNNGASMLLATSTRTILHASWHSDGTSQGELYCGDNVSGVNIIDTMGQNIIDTPLQFLCYNSPIWVFINTVQGKGIDTIITWIDRDISLSNEIMNVIATTTIISMPTQTFSTTTDFTPLIIFSGIFLFFFVFFGYVKFFKSNDF